MSLQTQHAMMVDSVGPADAPTLVFLHGGGSAAWMWKPVLALLPEYHCLVPDLPEHGRSREVKPFSMAYAADLVAQVIRTQAHGAVAHMIGLSEGAQVCVELLSQAPETVRSAFISSATLRPMPATAWLTPSVLSAMYYTTVAPLKKCNAWIRLNMRYAAGVPERYFDDFKADFQSMTRDAWVNLMRANVLYRLPAGLERADAPVLVVAGSKEYTAMIQSARDLAAALPNARACLVSLGERASMAQEHNWALTAPQIFADAVRAWITGAPLPGELKPLE